MAELTNLYDRAARARDHFERFVTLIDGLRDAVLDEDCNVIPKYAEAEFLLAYIDEETQHVFRRIDGLVHELRRADS
jgi:hypothetical protein